MSKSQQICWVLTLCFFIGFTPKAYAQPSNDECNTAINISNTSNWCSPNAAYTNVLSTASVYGTPTCWSNSGNDVWFRFTASAPAVTITVNGNVAGAGTGNLNQPELALYRDNCAGGTVTEIQCQPGDGTNSASVYEGALVVGNSYLIRVDGKNSNTGTFQLCVDNYFPPAQPGADCSSAAALCTKDTISFVNLTGFGFDGTEGAGTCIGASTVPGANVEKNAAWFTWIAADNGTITFDIIPTNPADDLDFVVYELPNGTCGDATGANAIRCCASGDSGIPSPCMGPTGLNLTSVDVVENLGCYATDDNYVQFITQVPGRMYALQINNFSSAGNGFNLQWGGTGQFAGPTPGFTQSVDTTCFSAPQLTVTDNTVNAVNISYDFGFDATPATATGVGPHNIVYSSPGEKYIVQTVEGPGGCLSYFIDTLVITELPDFDSVITHVDCNGEETGAIDITMTTGTAPYTFNWTGGTLSAPVTTEDITNVGAGFYTLDITDDAGCMNSFNLEIIERPAIAEAATIVDDACEAGIGSITANISGGTRPFTYEWSDGQSDSAATNLTTGTYELIVIDANGCRDTFDFNVGDTPQPIANAGPDATVCATQHTLAAVASSGIGTWTATAPVTFADPNDPNSPVTANNYGIIDFYWTEVNGVCSDTDTVVISFVEPPTADAGTDRAVCGNSVQIDANPSSGTGTWTDNSGGQISYFPSANSPTVLASFPSTPPGGATVEFYWTEVNGPCSDEDTMIVEFYDLPPADAGPGGSVCGLTFTLNSPNTVGNGTWTAEDTLGNPISATYVPDANSTNPDVTVPNFDHVIFTWTVDQGVCNSFDTVLVKFLVTPSPNAGPDDTTCALSYVLNATPSVGTGTWTSVIPGVTFSNPNDPNATVTVPAYGNYTFRWEEQNGPCTDQDDVAIEFFQVPPIAAGADQNICASQTTTLSGSPTGPTGNGSWTARDSLGNLVNPVYSDNTDPNSTVDFSGVGYGCYSLIWRADYTFCEVSDTADICFYQMPVSNAGTDDSICSQTYTLAAISSLPIGVGMGTWSSSEPSAVFVDPNDPNTDVTVGVFNNIEFYWNEANGPCSDIDTVMVAFRQTPSPMAGADQSLCADTTTLTAIASVGTATWTSNNANITITNPAGPSTQIDLAGEPYGTYEFYYTEDNGACVVTDTVEVTFQQQPIADAGADQIVCGPNYTLQAIASAGTGTWTTNDPVTFSNVNDANAVVSTTTFITAELYWTEVNGPCTDVDTIIVTFLEEPTSDAGPDQDVCSLTGTLAAVPSAGNGSWSSNASVTFGNVGDPNSTINASGAGYGTYTIYWTESNGSCTATDSMEFSFNETPQANAGPVDSVCSQTYSLQAVPSVGTGMWTINSGPGTLSDPADSNATITVSSFDPVTLTWTETNGNCSSSSQTTIYFFQPVNPNAGLDDGVCGFEYTLQGSVPSGTGTWTGPQGAIFSNPNMSSTLVDVSTIGYGTHTFSWTDDNVICSETDDVEITFLDDPVAAFNCEEIVLYTTEPVYQFLDQSNRGDFFDWNFGDGNTSDEQDPEHTFTELGNFNVSLTVTDSFGCSNTVNCLVRVKDDLRLFVPTAFTPDNDDINEEFFATIVGHREGSFNMKIYDRWGKLMFEGNDPSEKWNGRSLNVGEKAPNGIYTVVISYQNYANATDFYRGRLTLVR